MGDLEVENAGEWSLDLATLTEVLLSLPDFVLHSLAISIVGGSSHPLEDPRPAVEELPEQKSL